MKRLPFSLFALSLSFSVAAACDVEKDDEPLNTQAIEDDTTADDDDADDGDDDDAQSTGSDETAGTTAGTGEDPGDDTGDDSAGTGEGGGTGEVNAFAIRHGDLPDLDDGGESTGGDSGDGGDDIPADAVHVIISGSGIKTCEMPYEGEPCGGNWSVSFLLSPDMLEPGSYALFDDANGGFTFADQPYEEGDCAWGGGSLDGVLVIEGVDEEGIVGHIEGSDAFDFDADIDFYAPHCG